MHATPCQNAKTGPFVHASAAKSGTWTKRPAKTSTSGPGNEPQTHQYLQLAKVLLKLRLEANMVGRLTRHLREGIVTR